MSKKRPAAAHAWLGETVEIAIVLALVFLSTTAIAQPFYVPSGSMEPTLQIGDAFLGSKFPYGYSRYSLPVALGPHSGNRLLERAPSRGDVVVFRHPGKDKESVVKRLVGLPGDTVQMVHGRLIINGEALPLEPAGDGTVEEQDGQTRTVARYIETLPGGVRHPIFKWRWDGMTDDTAPVTVPPGHFFMMGDNRDNSLDSRVPLRDGGIGPVPAENLTARADVMLGSFDFPNAGSPAEWAKRFRMSRFFQGIH